MPNTEPMTGIEMARAVVDIKAGITALNAKLDKVPDWDDLTRQEQRRDREQTKQDDAIAGVESKITTLMFSVIGAALTAVVGVLRTL